MTLFPEYRRCPECGELSVPTSEIYPDGTRCLHCQKHIENNAAFVVILVIALVVVMFVDFKVLGTGIVGYVCAAALFIVGGPIKWSHPTLMPLKCYTSD